MNRLDYDPTTTGIAIRHMEPPDHLEPSGARTQRAIDSRTDTIGQLALAMKAIHKLLVLLGTTEVPLDTFQADNGPMATIKRDGNKYLVRKGQS